jgi:CrcB protein
MHQDTQTNEQAQVELRDYRYDTRRLARLRDIFERRRMLTTILAIALGAAIGANLRYGLSLWAAQQWGAAFPYGTMIINVLGSFAIGAVMVLLTTRLAVSDLWRLLIVTGLLGGFTTFSTFSYETYGLLVSGSWLGAALNIVGSVALAMIGVFLGAGLARLLP